MLFLWRIAELLKSGRDFTQRSVCETYKNSSATLALQNAGLLPDQRNKNDEKLAINFPNENGQLTRFVLQHLLNGCVRQMFWH